MEELRKIFVKYKDNLTTRERDVIRLLFGLDDGILRTKKEVSQLFGTTVEDIIEKQISALTKMPNFWETFQKADKNEWQLYQQQKMGNNNNRHEHRTLLDCPKEFLNINFFDTTSLPFENNEEDK